jgi:plastocyanin
MRQKRAYLALGCLALTSAVAPHHLAFQVVDQRGLPLQGAVVEIARPAGDVRPVTFATHYGMAQRNVMFVPGTLLVPAGTTVAFPNLDTVRHSIYSFSKAGRFQIDLYGHDQTRTHQFSVPGSIALGCHIHDQMRGYIRVSTTPYAAITDLNGTADVTNLPTGSYAVTVWHPQGRGSEGEWHGTMAVTENHPNRITIATR